ncbi:MAG: hypothetical protein J2P52_01260 [Blastocatellia bacterium]|nr:hypothetical protein [Blastocatellia bacterium]
MKNIPCLLALALLGASHQFCRTESARGGANPRPAALNQASPQPDSQRANETVVPAPSTFRENFVGRIGNKYDISMSLERKGAELIKSALMSMARTELLFLIRC